MEWKKESPACWDESKRRIVGGAPAGVFDLGPFADGEVLPGEWWRVEENGEILGYGWMDITWGDGEILLAVPADQEGKGVGTFILDRLEDEARSHGLNYIYNQINPKHPDYEGVAAWLEGRRFHESSEGLLRRDVRRV
ncbi:MAG: GNAT family N-acetyltransferase [Planctomycetota bacterium]